MIERVFGCLLNSLGWLIMVSPLFARCRVPSKNLVCLPARGKGRDDRCMLREAKVKNIGTWGGGGGGWGGTGAGGEREGGGPFCACKCDDTCHALGLSAGTRAVAFCGGSWRDNAPSGPQGSPSRRLQEIPGTKSTSIK